jgi:hypothetical protein
MAKNVSKKPAKKDQSISLMEHVLHAHHTSYQHYQEDKPALFVNALTLITQSIDMVNAIKVIKLITKPTLPDSKRLSQNTINV